MSFYDTTVLADSPLLFWKLDDAALSTIAADASGNSNTGTVTAWTFQQVAQFPGSAFGSNPTNSGGKIISPSIAFGTTQVTVEMWVNFNGTGGTGTYMLFSFGTHYLSGEVQSSAIGVNTGVGDQYGCALPGSGVHHLVMVMPNNQATTNAKIYLDGVLQTLSGSSGTAPNLGTATFQVSNWPPASLPTPAAVHIDDVAVYSGALSAARVLAHYNAGFHSPDAFADAWTVGVGVATTYSVVTTGFTTETSEPLTCPVSATAWFSFTPSTSGVYQIDTIGSGYDTGLSVYTGTALANLARLAFDDDTGGSSTSRLVLELIGGTQYYIQAGAGPSAGTTTGTLVLNVSANLRAAPASGWGAHA